MKFNKENYMDFERKWFKYETLLYPQRLGQAVCNYFDMPKEIEDKIFYEIDVKKVQVILWSSFDTVSERELTQKEIERQNFVDSEIHTMICNVLAHVDPENLPDWDIEPIAEIRDVILRYYIDGKYDEMDFYPYLEE